MLPNQWWSLPLQVSRLYIQRRNSYPSAVPKCLAFFILQDHRDTKKMNGLKQQTRLNYAENPSSPPKEVVRTLAATCPWSQCSLLHTVQPLGGQCSSSSSSLSRHMATTIALPKGLFGLLIVGTQMIDSWISALSIPKYCPQEKAWKQVSWVTPRPSSDGGSKGHIPNNRDAPVLDCWCHAS